MKFNIQESRKVKKFSEYIMNRVHYTKSPYAKITMDKDVDKFLDGYENFIGSGIKVQEKPDVPGRL